MGKKRIDNKANLELAAALYLDGGYTIKDIAATLGYSERSVEGWSVKHEWKERKQVLQVSPIRIKKRLLESIEAILDDVDANDRALTSKEADTIKKLTSSIEDLEKKNTPGVVMNVFTEFNQFAKHIDLDTTKKCIELQKQFIKNKLALNGKV